MSRFTLGEEADLLAVCRELRGHAMTRPFTTDEHGTPPSEIRTVQMDCGCNAETATVCLAHALPSAIEDDARRCEECGDRDAEPFSNYCYHCRDFVRQQFTADQS